MRLLDSTVLVDLMRGKKESLDLINTSEIFLTTQINMYEIIIGLFKKRISRDKFQKVLRSFNDIRVLSLDDASIIKSAEIYNSLVEKGREVSDCDCFIAGIALSNGIRTIISKNKKHFERIKGINVVVY